MKLIAHRGASLRCQDNSLAGLQLASDLGADAVECDVQQTKDGVYILFHDPVLNWTWDDPRAVCDMTYEELNQFLAERDYRLYTLEEVLTGYRGDATILFDINLPAPKEDFFHMLKDSGHKVICGLSRFDSLSPCRRVFPTEQILAFVPPPEKHRFAEYHKAGAGIVRLWEDWLPEITPADVKKVCPDAQVFIMSKDPVTDMNGNPASLARLADMGADGVLLNDIEMAVREMKK